MKLAVVLAATLLAPAAQAEEWTRLVSPNFELYTTAGARDAHQTLETFEKVRDFLLRIRPQSINNRLPVTIIGFRNAKEYRAFRAREGVVAYYTGDEQRDLVVIGSLGADHAPEAAVHEYIHVLLRHTGLKVPVWLNEGLADVFSTLQPRADQLLLGAVPPGRDVVLQREKWLPLEQLTAVSSNSPEYNEAERMGIFYAESWLLTHMLMLSPEFAQKFPDFVTAVTASGDAGQSWQKVYGRSTREIRSEMEAYFRTNSLKGRLFDTKFNKVSLSDPVPVDDFDRDLLLARLTTMLGRFEEAGYRLKRLAESHPGNVDIEEALGYLAWRKGDAEAARLHLGNAVDAGVRNWKTNWDYARLVASQEHDAARFERALRAAIGGNPALTDARLVLGHDLYAKKRYADALEVLAGIQIIHPEKASSMLLLKASCALQLKQKVQAAQFAAEALKYGLTESARADAQRLVDYIAHDGQTAVPASASAQNAAAPLASNAPLISARGTLIQLDCLDPQARLHVRTAETTHVLLVSDPNQVSIRNSEGKPVEMKCGPQKTAVLVEFVPVLDAKTGTSGQVRVLQFLP